MDDKCAGGSADGERGGYEGTGLRGADCRLCPAYPTENIIMLFIYNRFMMTI
jgi:hypothetical protein